MPGWIWITCLEFCVSSLWKTNVENLDFDTNREFGMSIPAAQS